MILTILNALMLATEMSPGDVTSVFAQTGMAGALLYVLFVLGKKIMDNNDKNIINQTEMNKNNAILSENVRVLADSMKEIKNFDVLLLQKIESLDSQVKTIETLSGDVDDVKSIVKIMQANIDEMRSLLKDIDKKTD